MEPAANLTAELARRLGSDSGSPAGELVAWPGEPFPIGTRWDGEGTNFAIWSPSATGAEVCLFDGSGAEHRVRLGEHSFHIWHGYIPGINPGQRYGFRLSGPYDPAAGQRHNRSKLLRPICCAVCKARQ